MQILEGQQLAVLAAKIRAYTSLHSIQVLFETPIHYLYCW